MSHVDLGSLSFKCSLWFKGCCHKDYGCIIIINLIAINYVPLNVTITKRTAVLPRGANGGEKK